MLVIAETMAAKPHEVSETWNGGTALDKKAVIINKPYKIHLTPYKATESVIALTVVF